MSFRDFIEAVRERTDIVALVGRDVKLEPAGKTLKGCSPFCPEKHPSFFVWPATQSWYDYAGGGGRGGDVFAYVQQRDKCSFKEALYLLADAAGVKRPDRTDEEHEREVARIIERREVERLLGAAAAYYHRVLPDSIRQERYVEHYGFTAETVDTLLLGWADGHLYEHFRHDLRVAHDLAIKTGLFVVLAGGRTVDFFQSRLVFPYWSGGRVVYFIGRRTLEPSDLPAWEQAKYKKLPTTSDSHPYISKTIGNDYFYNEDDARGADELLVTEGVTDCISARQAGFPCISPVTVRFREQDTPKLLELTRRAKRIVICNDAETNNAGENGARATAAALAQAGRVVRIATLPRSEGVDKVDINEFLKAQSPDQLRAVLSAAPTFLEFEIDRVPADTSKAELGVALAPVFAAIGGTPPMERDALTARNVKRFDVKRSSVHAMVRAARASATPEAATDAESVGARVRGEVREAGGHYLAIAPNGSVEVLSSFTIEPTYRIDNDSGEQIVANLHLERGGVIRDVVFPKSAWLSRREFLRALPSPDLQWTGTDDHVQGLLRLTSSKVTPRRLGTTNLGYCDTPNGPRWVAPGVVIGPDGFHESDEVFYLAGSSEFSKRVSYAPIAGDDRRNLAAAVLPSLLELNEPAVILPIIGWFFATPFRPRILQQLGHFPVLMIWGSQGSGKTSIVEEVFWPLFGVAKDRRPFSATETEFAFISLLSASDSVPVFIDEYRPRDMKKDCLDRVHRLLRRVYGGEVDQRGRPDLTVASYRISAPVCLAGESRPEDAALVERFISVSPNKNRLAASPVFREAFQRVRSQDLARLAAPYIQFSLGRDNTASDLARARETTQELLSALPNREVIPGRCRDNLTVMVFGLAMYKEFAASLGVAVPELDIAPAVSACIEDLLDGDRGAKDPLDRFLEALSTLAHLGKLVEGNQYAMVGGLLCIHLPTAYQVYLRERKQAGQEDDTNGLRALRRLIRENYERRGYVVEPEKRVNFGGRFVRTVAIDLKEVPSTFDVEEFPCAQDRSHGGARSRVGGGFHDGTTDDDGPIPLRAATSGRDRKGQ